MNENINMTAEEATTAIVPEEAPVRKHSFEPIKAGAITVAKTTGLAVGAGVALFAASALVCAGAVYGHNTGVACYSRRHKNVYELKTAPIIETSTEE